jgi:VanZ family protein
MAHSATATRTHPALKAAKYWLPVAVMLAVMYYFSTDTFSSDNTRGLIATALGWIFPALSDNAIARANYFARKAGHLLEYAILTALLFRAFRSDNLERWRLRWAVYSIMVVVCWALLDEYHQSFTRKRSGSAFDSMLDSAGGLAALALIRFKNRRQASGAFPPGAPKRD